MPLSGKAKWFIIALGSLGFIGLCLLLTLLGTLLWPSQSFRGGATVQLGQQVESRGMVQVNQDHDGATEPAVAGGLECHAFKPYPGRPEQYAYFKIDPKLKETGTNEVMVQVEYFDGEAGGNFRLDYDSHNGSSKDQGAYTQSKEKVYLKGTQRWRKGRFLLDDGRFEGRQNDGADFRITVVGTQFFLRSVTLTRE